MKMSWKPISEEEAIIAIKQEHIRVFKGADGRAILQLVIDHQSFTFDNIFGSEYRAEWMARQLAVALHRFRGRK